MTRVLLVTLGVSLLAVQAAPTQFVIVNSNGAAGSRGTYSNGGEFWGSFVLDPDLTQIVPGTNEVFTPIHEFDVFTTGGYTREFHSTDNGAFANYWAQRYTLPPPVGEAQYGRLLVGYWDDESVTGWSITMTMIQPAAGFRGGVVLYAEQRWTNSYAVLASDSSGSAMIVDPALVAPEPSTVLLFAGGLLCLGIIARLRRISIVILSGLWRPRSPSRNFCDGMIAATRRPGANSFRMCMTTCGGLRISGCAASGSITHSQQLR